MFQQMVNKDLPTTEAEAQATLDAFGSHYDEIHEFLVENDLLEAALTRELGNVHETLAALDLAESIPADRLNPWHTVTIDSRTWHIAHGVLCDLATCPFDAQARKWAKPPVAVGVYRWHDPHGPLVPEGADDGPTE